MPQIPYRPGSGTEGADFQGRFCKRCTKDSEDDFCPILGNAMILLADHPDYPPEWIEDDDGIEEIDGPRCTAFEPREVAAPENAAASE